MQRLQVAQAAPLQSHSWYNRCAFVQHYHVEMKAFIDNFEKKKRWIEGVGNETCTKKTVVA